MIALCVGHSAYDFIVLSNDFPLENSKTSFNDVYEGAGGTMSNVSYLLGKYGIETYLASVIGDDTFGNIIKRDLEKVGVHTEYIETAYGKRTHLAFIIINKTEKTRTVYKVAKDDLLLKKTDFPINPDVVIVDSDEIKKMFPDFDKNDVKSASYFHEESSAVAKRIVRIAQDNNYNVLLDGTGDGGLKGLRKKIKDAKERGYKIKACYGTCSMEEALIRNQKRYDGAIARGEVARRVPEKEVLKTHKKVSALLPEVASEFDSVEVYDFNDFNNIKHIATGGSGKPLTPTKEYEKEYNEFLEKAKVKINE